MQKAIKVFTFLLIFWFLFSWAEVLIRCNPGGGDMQLSRVNAFELLVTAYGYKK